MQILFLFLAIEKKLSLFLDRYYSEIYYEMLKLHLQVKVVVIF